MLEAVARQTRELWAGLAAREPDNRPETLVDLLWNRLCTPLGFEFTMERKPDDIQLHCTRCPINELAQELDALAHVRRRQATYKVISETGH